MTVEAVKPMAVESDESGRKEIQEETSEEIAPETSSEATGRPAEEQLRKELEEERAKSDLYLNQLKRLKADYENLQKRTKREMDDVVKSANERLIIELLGVMDHLELAVEAGKKCENKEELVRGVEMVLEGFKETLGRQGLAEIDAAGKRFDPRRHMAMEQVSTDALEDETVIAVMRRGYTLNGRVIRPSMVKVAIKSTTEKDREEKTQ